MAIDLKEDKIYKATQKPEIVDVPKMLFVTVDGKGYPGPAPGGPENEFQQAIQILYGIVYTIKFWDKKYAPPKGYDKFSVAPLEGQWWTISGKSFDAKNETDWRWKLMLRLPEFVTPEFFDQVVAEISKRKKSDAFEVAKLETIEEGTSVQLMHIGPYDMEEPDINRMHEFAKHAGYKLVGLHHELYFSDPRRTKPDKLRTIIRQPVTKAWRY